MAQRRNPRLDGVRGLAILGVVLTHSTFWIADIGLARMPVRIMALGTKGVDLFFVLSGFLITEILLRTRDAQNRSHSFYARRILRIFPIYYASLIVACFTAFLFPHLESLMIFHDPLGLTGYLFYLQNCLVLNGKFLFENSVLGHFWTLAVEEQFYLVWPWIVWSVPPKYVLRLCIAGSAAVLLIRILFVRHWGLVFWIRNFTLTRADTLLSGGALAAFIYSGKRITWRTVFATATLGLSVLAIVVVHSYHELRADKGYFMSTIGYSGVALVCCALVGSAFCRVPIVNQLFQARFLRLLGKYSYGIYVYHVPVNFAVRAMLRHFGIEAPLPLTSAAVVIVVQISVACAIAWLSYTFFESRLLALKQRFQPEFHNHIAPCEAA